MRMLYFVGSPVYVQHKINTVLDGIRVGETIIQTVVYGSDILVAVYVDDRTAEKIREKEE